MIRVNLLPVEMRKSEGPPLGRLAIIVGDAVLISGALLLFCWFRLVELPKVRQQLTDLKDKVKTASLKSAEYDKLVVVKAVFEERKGAFEQLSSKRMIWSKKLAELSEVFGSQPVWIDDLAVDSKPGAQGGTVHIFKSKVWVAGTEEPRATRFRQSLRANEEYWKDFYFINDSGLQLSKKEFSRDINDKSVTFREKDHYTFSLVQTMHERGIPPKPVGKPAGRARPAPRGR